jgi:AraC-like DNA-binding protein/tetratricopeptide (TPR) repeat protein
MQLKWCDRNEDRTALPLSVRRALSAMRAAPDRALGLAALAAMGSVSARTLQRHFKAFLGKTPQAALRDIRLARARGDLLRASSTGTVTEIALRYGFVHLGRFSVEYRQRDDEKPSETLLRRRKFLAQPRTNATIAPTFARELPTICVLPIAGHGGDEPLARSVADELATALMRAGITVSNRPELARYHLNVTLHRAGRDIGLTSRLIDVATGRHLWAHRHVGTSSELFSFEDVAAASVVAAIEPGLSAAEIDRAWRKPKRDLTANDLTLRALPLALALETDANLRALDLLGKATDRDPDHAFAVALSSWCIGQRRTYTPYLLTNAPAQDCRRLWLQATTLARHALTIADGGRELAILGNAFAITGDLETADAVTQKALSISGSSAWAWSRSGLIDMWKGCIASALDRLYIALDLARNDPLVFNSLIGIGLAHFQVGRYLEATRWLQRAIAEHPAAVWGYQVLCASHMLCGQKTEARRSLARLRSRYPDLTIDRVMTGFSFLPRVSRENLVDALEVAGLPR